MTSSIRMIIVDDHPLIKEGIKQILSFYPNLEIVGEGCNGLEAIELTDTIDTDFLLLDINMPTLNGIEAVKTIRPKHPKLKILLLTVENDFQTLKEAIDLHIDGYILKDSAGTTLIDAIKHVEAGGSFIDQTLTKYVFNMVQEGTLTEMPSLLLETDPFKHLSEREKEILYYISSGLSNKEIASKLFLSDKTVRNVITTLFKKIQVKDRVQATIYALNHHLHEYK